MESLPLEVVEMIAQHLSPRDLAACCATGHSWRDLFNQDLFWKHLCKQEAADYLTRTPCRVKPAFISPEVEGSGLDPVCQWRMNYMRENHLLINWRSGRCQEETLDLEDEDTLNFYKEDFVITMRFEGKVMSGCEFEMEMKVMIVDVRCDPVIYMYDPCLLIPLSYHYKLFLCDDRVVVVQRSAVLVFQINLMKNKWPLEHIFIYEEDKPTDFIRASNATKKTNRRSMSYKNYTLIVGNYLLAINFDSKWDLHIWDIVNGLKLKKETLDKRESVFSTIQTSTTSQDDVIVFVSTTGEFTKVLVYSLLRFTYYPCVFQGVQYCNLHRDKIVVNMIIPSSHWLIANYKTGEQIHRIEDIGCLSSISFEVFDNKLIYISNGGLNQINLATGEIKQFLDARGFVNYFKVLGDKFIFMQVNRGEDLRSQLMFSPEFGIWEFPVSKRLVTTFSNMGIIENFITNKTLTKMIITFAIEASVVSFW